MEKWIARGINPFTASTGDALILAGCRYLNTAQFPNMEELAAILGIVQEEDKNPKETVEVYFTWEDKPCTEE